MTAQLAFRLEHPAGTLPLICRAAADKRCLRAVCDWSREGPGFTSVNGWTVLPRQIDGCHASDRRGWVASAPDGVAEWWALDPVTAMVRAEGGS
jgi:hypothetical protein